MPFHPDFGMGHRLEPKTSVKLMRVARGEVQSPQAIQLWMGHDTLDEPFAESPPAMAFQHIDIAKVAERGAVSDDAGQADLRLALKKSDRKSTRLNSSHHRLSRMPSSA